MANFVKFKNFFKGNVTEDIWINIDHITTAYESLDVDVETNKMKPSVTLFSKEGLDWQVDDSINEVAEKLREKIRDILEGYNLGLD